MKTLLVMVALVLLAKSSTTESDELYELQIDPVDPNPPVPFLAANLMIEEMPDAAADEFEPDADLDERWAEYKDKFNKKYANPAEESVRRQAWEKQIAQIQIHNQEFAEGRQTFTIGENQFTDGSRPAFGAFFPRGRK